MSKELLDCCIELPNIQRIRDDSKVEEIVNYQREQLLNNGQCDFHGVINTPLSRNRPMFFSRWTTSV